MKKTAAKKTGPPTIRPGQWVKLPDGRGQVRIRKTPAGQAVEYRATPATRNGLRPDKGKESKRVAAAAKKYIAAAAARKRARP